jgi:hypothetical protein
LFSFAQKALGQSYEAGHSWLVYLRPLTFFFQMPSVFSSRNRENQISLMKASPLLIHAKLSLSSY